MKKSHKVLLSIAVLLAAVVIFAFTPPPVETYKVVRNISASKQVVWQVISDVGNYHKYATGLSGVTIVSGEGAGMVRACSDAAGSWKETCTAWDEGTSYSFDVDTGGEGYPYPFRNLNATWAVNEIGFNTSQLLITFEFQFPYRWLSWFFTDATLDILDQGNKTLLDNWERRITELAKEPASESTALVN